MGQYCTRMLSIRMRLQKLRAEVFLHVLVWDRAAWHSSGGLRAVVSTAAVMTRAIMRRSLRPVELGWSGVAEPREPRTATSPPLGAPSFPIAPRASVGRSAGRPKAAGVEWSLAELVGT